MKWRKYVRTRWGLSGASFVGSVIVVEAAVSLDVEAGVRQRQEGVLVEAFVPNAAVERFEVRVLAWPPGLDERKHDAPIGGPRIECATPQLAAIVQRPSPGAGRAWRSRRRPSWKTPAHFAFPNAMSRITHSYAVGDHPVLRTGFA